MSFLTFEDNVLFVYGALSKRGADLIKRSKVPANNFSLQASYLVLYNLYTGCEGDSSVRTAVMSTASSRKQQNLGPESVRLGELSAYGKLRFNWI